VRAVRTIAVALSVLALAGCAGTGDAAPGTTAPAGSGTAADGLDYSGTLTVLAAASLTGTFDELATAFEREHPSVDVVVSYGGSSALAQQILAGSPADVFAAASRSTMATVTDAGLADGAPALFATNTLEIAVPPGNPDGITGIDDFANEDATVAVCATEVPCGAAADGVFAAAGVTPSIDTFEEDVRGVLTKVELGEVDAGLVYRTDVLSAGSKVDGVEFPEAADVVNDYPIAVLARGSSERAVAARAFVDLVLGDTGRTALADAGFGTP
jgi:molybdate transport system substrate-binding protein